MGTICRFILHHSRDLPPSHCCCGEPHCPRCLDQGEDGASLADRLTYKPFPPLSPSSTTEVRGRPADVKRSPVSVRRRAYPSQASLPGIASSNSPHGFWRSRPLSAPIVSPDERPPFPSPQSYRKTHGTVP